MILTPSPACLALVREFEGVQLKAYLCPANIWTLGVGHTGGVKRGDRCTDEQADAWLLADLNEAAESVRALVKVPLTQSQFDALCSFVFNLGARAFAESTLLILLNKGQHKLAAAQFARWVHGGGKRLPGLVRRRAAEADLFLKGVA